MAAIKRSRAVLLCLLLVVTMLVGVFVILNASSVYASKDDGPPPKNNNQPNIIISPPELEALLYPGKSGTQSLWITNTADSPITYTIFEISGAVRADGYTLTPASIPVVDPEARTQVDNQGKADVIVLLRQAPNLSLASQIMDKHARRTYVYDRLLENASYSQSLFDWLVEQGTQPKRFISADAIAATVNTAQLDVLAANPLVRQIRPNRLHAGTISDVRTQVMGPTIPALTTVQPVAVEWNIAMIRADQAWEVFGARGEGAVVGILDTGVLYDHPALVNSYRGNLGDGAFDHNYNWMDFVNGLPVPYDGMGHGTMVTGIVTGDDGESNQIGVAPGADWMAAKVCDDGGVCSDYSIYQGFDWMMAPTDLNGQNADPAKAPDIVFGGWGGGRCDNSFDFYFMALRAAGILAIFPGGHSGPACDSIGSPGDSGLVVTAGMTDENDAISYLSPRGPGCNGLIKPDVVAPGENIRSSYNDGGYMVWSGSAESSAHVAGVAALMVSANPSLGAGTLEPILFATSICHDDLTCGGENCPGANNVWGHGRIDAFGAVYAALGNPPQGEIPWLSESPISGTLPVGGGVEVSVTFDTADLVPGDYNGALGILSADPTLPFTLVPVSLDVVSPAQPVIIIHPLSFSASLPVGGVQTDTLTIRNTGGDVLSFNLHEISGTLMTAPAQPDLSIQDPYPAGNPPQVDPTVYSQLLFLGHSRLIIYLRGSMDFSAASLLTSRAERGQYVYEQLLTLSSRGNSLYEWLQSQGAEPQRLLVANAIAATLDRSLLQEVLKYPQAGKVSINGYHEILPGSTVAAGGLPFFNGNPDNVGWNIAKIRADETWATFGVTGQGAVVGIVDTGVVYDHPALINSYRGNLGGGVFDHNYNWFDFVDGLPIPYDLINHGTMGAGIISGDDGVGNQIGVAPGAEWMAARACDMACTDEDLLAALQWMLAPTDLSGYNPDPSKAPDVVIGMWGGAGCDLTFQSSLLALRSAGILPVFPPGSMGSGCSTMGSPGDLPEALSAGATDQNDMIAPFSSRGPSCHGEIKPDLSAPGVEIRTSTNVYSYTITSGTSWSAAHVAGAAALVISADQSLGLNNIEDILFSTAVCREALVCGGEACPGANNTYGHGRIDVFEAVSTTLNTYDDVPWLVAGPLEGELQPGESITTTVGIHAAGLDAGIYHAGIEVESNDPLSPLTTLPVTLTVYTPCQPITEIDANYLPPAPIVGETVTFTASANGTEPITYTWNIDGMVMPGPVVTYAFPEAATYAVWVEVENACTQSLVVLLYVPVHQEVMLPVVSK
jgi:subtilisin family serine protease